MAALSGLGINDDMVRNIVSTLLAALISATLASSHAEAKPKLLGRYLGWDAFIFDEGGTYL